MANAPKNNKPAKANNKNQDTGRVMNILRKEYAFENWLLAILSPILIVFGVYTISGSFGSVTLSYGGTGIGILDFFFNTDLKRILTGSFLVLIGTLVLVYLFIPYLRPSVAEMKKVSWPTGKELVVNSVRVIGFILVVSLFFVVFGLGLDPLFKLIYNL